VAGIAASLTSAMGFASDESSQKAEAALRRFSIHEDRKILTADLNQAATNDSDPTLAFQSLAELAESDQRWSDAAQWLAKCTAAPTPCEPRQLLQREQLLLHSGAQDGHPLPDQDAARLNAIKAQVSLLSGSVQSARRLADTAISQNTADWETHFAKGLVLSATNQISGAIREFEDAKAAAPTDMGSRIASLVERAKQQSQAQALLHQAARNLDDKDETSAQDALLSAWKMDPSLSEAGFGSAALLAWHGDKKTATEILHTLSSSPDPKVAAKANDILTPKSQRTKTGTPPRQPDSQLTTIRDLLRKESYLEARRRIGEAIARGKSGAQLQLLLADQDELTKNWTGAEQALRMALPNIKDHALRETILWKLDWITLWRGTAPTSAARRKMEFRRYLSETATFLGSGRPVAAILRSRDADATMQGRWEPPLMASRAYALINDWTHAQAQWEVAKSRAPIDADPVLADAKAQLDRLHQAADLQASAASAESAKDFKTAAKLYSDAYRLNPDRADTGLQAVKNWSAAGQEANGLAILALLKEKTGGAIRDNIADLYGQIREIAELSDIMKQSAKAKTAPPISVDQARMSAELDNMQKALETEMRAAKEAADARKEQQANLKTRLNEVQERIESARAELELLGSGQQPTGPQGLAGSIISSVTQGRSAVLQARLSVLAAESSQLTSQLDPEIDDQGRPVMTPTNSAAGSAPVWSRLLALAGSANAEYARGRSSVQPAGPSGLTGELSAPSGLTCPNWSSKFNQIQEPQVLQQLRSQSQSGFANQITQSGGPQNAISVGQQTRQQLQEEFAKTQTIIAAISAGPSALVTVAECVSPGSALQAARCQAFEIQDQLLAVDGVIDIASQCRSGGK
jgi:hypothetical protein